MSKRHERRYWIDLSPDQKSRIDEIVQDMGAFHGLRSHIGRQAIEAMLCACEGEVSKGTAILESFASQAKAREAANA